MMDYVKHLEKNIALYERIAKDYKLAVDGLHYEQDVMNDISHKLELCKTTATERQNLATIYAHAARKRRKYKEQAEILKPFVDSNACMNMAKHLRNVAKEMGFISIRQKTRQYTPRTNKIHFENAEEYNEMYDKKRGAHE